MRILTILIIAFLVARNVEAKEPLTIVKYMSNSANLSEDYYLDLIDAALKATQLTDGDYRIDFVEEQLSTRREQALLIQGERVNIDRLSGYKSETGIRQKLLLVDHPLLRDFMSYRIPLIRRDDQARFDAVKNLEDLKKIPLGLGKNWEGFAYQQSGFAVTEPITINLLFKMLAGGRYDFVPLSAIEIQDTYKTTDNDQTIANIGPENHLLIYLPLPTYFYVSRNEPMLAKRLKIGLDIIEDNGTMKIIFTRHFSERLKQLHLSKRLLIKIPHPYYDGSLGNTSLDELKDY